MEVSIIVPIYNSEAKLERCINSILSQSFSNYELILVNDGSKDSSFSICNKFATIDRRIIVLNQKNSGVSAARNLGLSVANGKYILFVDADDYIGSNFIESLIKSQSLSADIIVSGYVEINKGKEIPVNVNAPQKFTLQDLKAKYDSYKISNSVWAKLYKRSLIGNIKFDVKISMGEDLIFNLDYYRKCKNFVCIHSNEYFYDCTNSKSSTHNFKMEHFRCHKEIYQKEKMFKYGELKFCSDKTDLFFFIDCTNDIESICKNIKRKEGRKDYIKAIINDSFFSIVCQGNYEFNLKYKFRQFLCRHKFYSAIEYASQLRLF